MTEVVRQIPDWLIPSLILIISVVAVAIIIDRARLLISKIKAVNIEDERSILDMGARKAIGRSVEFLPRPPAPRFRGDRHDH